MEVLEDTVPQRQAKKNHFKEHEPLQGQERERFQNQREEELKTYTDSD